MNGLINQQLVSMRAQELRRVSQSARATRPPAGSPGRSRRGRRSAIGRRTTIELAALTLRRAHDADGPALARLAELDGQRLPEGPLLVGEVDGELWAAVRVGGPGAVADPFRPSAEIVGLLHRRARQLRERPAPPARIGALLALTRLGARPRARLGASRRA